MENSPSTVVSSETHEESQTPDDSSFNSTLWDLQEDFPPFEYQNSQESNLWFKTESVNAPCNSFDMETDGVLSIKNLSNSLNVDHVESGASECSICVDQNSSKNCNSNHSELKPKSEYCCTHGRKIVSNVNIDSAKDLETVEDSTLNSKLNVMYTETVEDTTLNSKLSVMDALEDLNPKLGVIDTETLEDSTLDSKLSVMESEIVENSTFNSKFSAKDSETVEDSSLNSEICYDKTVVVFEKESKDDMTLTKEIDYTKSSEDDPCEDVSQNISPGKSIIQSLWMTSSYVATTVSEIVVETESHAEVQQVASEFSCHTLSDFSEEKKSIKDAIETLSCVDSALTTKLEISSEEEEVNFDVFSAKSGAESSSSKDESGSGPSSSGISRASKGINSLSSDSETDLPSLNRTLPLKKRKRDSVVEVISSSSNSSDDEANSDTDYSNLTPDEIRALIEEARRYGGTKKKCKCPKKKWSELPIKGPIQSSGKCTIGKGNWCEKQPEECANCASGACLEGHQRRRGRKRGGVPRITASKTRVCGTIGVKVPIIDLSDSEDVNPVPNNVVSEVTISAVSTVPNVVEECIVLSSSEDDDDIVCEAVVKKEEKVLAVSQSAPHIPHIPHIPPFPMVTEADLWPDLSIDLENLDETMKLLENIVSPHAGTLQGSGPSTSSSAVSPERPTTPEGWRCPICLEPKTGVSEIMSTTCGHVFCGECIRAAVRLHKKCPTCRKKLTMKQFHKIFL